MQVLLVLREAGDLEVTVYEWLEKLLRIRAKHPGGTNDVVTIGEFTYGTPTVRKYDNTTRLTIGKFCSIGDNVQIILGGEHHTDYITTYPFDVLVDGKPTPSKGDVKIGNDVWIGNDVIILSGVTIGDGAVIGAGSVVTKNVAEYEVKGGDPARFIRWRFGMTERSRLAEMKWWDWPLDMINEAMPLLMSKDVDGLYQYWKEVVVHE